MWKHFLIVYECIVNDHMNQKKFNNINMNEWTKKLFKYQIHYERLIFYSSQNWIVIFLCQKLNVLFFLIWKICRQNLSNPASNFRQLYSTNPQQKLFFSHRISSGGPYRFNKLPRAFSNSHPHKYISSKNAVAVNFPKTRTLV